jgi:peroxiredoxin
MGKMMKKFLVWMIACLPAAALAQANQFTVEGSLGAYNAPAKIYLQYKSNDNYITDSATLVDGRFKFEGELAGDPVNAFMAFNSKGNGINNDDFKQVYLEKGIITVSGTDKLKNAVSGGTPSNIDNEKLNTEMAAVNRARESYWTKISTSTDQQKQSSEYQREMNKLDKGIRQQENEVYKKFITENPDSYVSLFALEGFANSADYKVIGSLYDQLSVGVKQTVRGRHFAARLPSIKATSIGGTGPDFTEADTSGKMVSLNSFRGKYVLIEFWASWCAPCRAESPNVLKVFNQYKGKNFTVIGVSLDGVTDRDKWLAAIQKDGLPWTQVSDLNGWNDRAAVLYLVGQSGIPQNFLLDPNGKIIAKGLRGSNLEDELEKVLGKM